MFLSNHYHLLACPSSARQLADFMGYFNGDVAKEAGRLHRLAREVLGLALPGHWVQDEKNKATPARERFMACHNRNIGNPRTVNNSCPVPGTASGTMYAVCQPYARDLCDIQVRIKQDNEECMRRARACQGGR